jgi:hypothetical protein
VRREAREAGTNLVDEQNKEEVNQKLRELQELAWCGTLDSSVKAVTFSEGLN